MTGAKCPRCKTPSNRALLFAFRGGKIIYACTKHVDQNRKDPITDWMRVGRISRGK